MSKFTPGPWVADIFTNGAFRIRPHGYDIPVIADRNECYPLVAEMEANARLIAAAPDMYEALQDIARYLGNKPFRSDGEELMIMRCKKVFAKVEE